MAALQEWPTGRVSRRGALTLLGGAIAMLLPPTRATAATVRRLRLICPSSWGARRKSGPYTRHTITRVTVHHSGIGFHHNRNAPARFRSHQANHQARGWPHIAYHFMIDRRGHIYRGRPEWAKGDTATNYNPRGHLLVMCEGNFEKQKPTNAQTGALVDVLAWAVTKYDLPLGRISGHRDHASTSCPGDHLYRKLKDGRIKRRVRRRIKAGGVSLKPICGDAGEQLVRRIERGTV